MTVLFVILMVLACVALGLIVLIQNPKGGGLAGNIAGFSTQFMGVKQTTDVLEKGTWLFGGIIVVLCLASTLFISRTSEGAPNKLQNVGGTGNITQPVNNQQPPTNQTTVPSSANPK
jgi:preprotein translocase subunit SecG